MEVRRALTAAGRDRQLLARLVYKNASQHRGTRHLQGLRQVLRDLKRIESSVPTGGSRRRAAGVAGTVDPNQPLLLALALCTLIQRAARWQLEVMSGAWFMSYTLVAFSALSRLHALFRFAVDRARARALAHPDAGLALFLASEHWAALAPLPSLPATETLLEPAAVPAAVEPSLGPPTLATAKPSSLHAALIDDGDDLGEPAVRPLITNKASKRARV